MPSLLIQLSYNVQTTCQWVETYKLKDVRIQESLENAELYMLVVLHGYSFSIILSLGLNVEILIHSSVFQGRKNTGEVYYSNVPVYVIIKQHKTCSTLTALLTIS